MTAVDELVTWLRAQLDRQQAALIAYRDHRAGLTPCDNLSDWDSCSVHINTAEATEYRDVDYGLAEVDAKRQLLDQHAPVVDGSQDSWIWFEGSESKSSAIVRLLALPFADRPGWREEWRP